MKCNKKYLSAGLKFLVVLACLAGFLFQSMAFMFFYWTYPTVVDIQVTSPSRFDMPAFTFCSHVGYILSKFCKQMAGPCPTSLFMRYAGSAVCFNFPDLCINGSILPAGFQLIMYKKFAQMVQFTAKLNEEIAMPLEEYLTCSIEFAGEKRSCDMESVMGSFYSSEDLPNYCFTIYSKWGQPEKEQAKIQKGAVMKFHFSLNATQAPLPEEETKNHSYNFRFNPPSTAAVQIAIHSPYYLPSPFLMGNGFLGGRAYEIQLKQEEKHLLPAPYQTNCTDYMSEWYARGGKAPVNQMLVIQECKLNHSLETLGCVPLSIDYPHQEIICKKCGKTNICAETERDNCTLLAENFNQPCDFISYEAEINQKVIIVPQILKSPFQKEPESINVKKNEHECDGVKAARPECSIVDVEITFERFEITNLTYNPKYESMETFSVIGGYMGMWLGISLVAVYDFLSTIFLMIKNTCNNKMKHKRRKRHGNKLKLKAPTGALFEVKNRKINNNRSIYSEPHFEQPTYYSDIYPY